MYEAKPNWRATEEGDSLSVVHMKREGQGQPPLCLTSWSGSVYASCRTPVTDTGTSDLIKSEPVDSINSIQNTGSAIIRHQRGMLSISDMKTQCKLCSKWIKSCSMKLHLQRVHSNIRHTCCHCNDTFTQAWTLRRHIASKHQQKKYRCDVCNKWFGRKDYFIEHMTTSFHKKQISLKMNTDN